jgi:hypothetical protein
MLRARELLAMGIDLQVIKTAVKLSIEEFQSLANTHSAVTRAA